MQDYLLHRIKANNRHGVHSPFVYNLIDTVIYDYSNQAAYSELEAGAESGGLKPKVIRLIYRLAKHFNPVGITIIGNGNASANLHLQKAVPKAKFNTAVTDQELIGITKSDLVVFYGDNLKASTLKYFEACLPKVNEETILMFTNMHQDKNLKQTWNHVKAHPRVTLTIDLFWIGLVFFKIGRAEKEHFKVKY
ncbi:hypothetical protein [Mucilaginibacter sp. FT3.2]|uniref:hypothetical protein n=1 Tax=Mucilaginibacter sp. FT3.2 TaxID=2723090 RepID=UPI003B002034